MGNAKRISLVGIGLAGPVALHAAALDGQIAEVTIENTIRPWVEDVVVLPLRHRMITRGAGSGRYTKQ